MTETRFPYQGPDELLPRIVDTLERVVDPEVAMNIVDLGLVYGVDVHDDTVEVRITMTSAACPVADVIIGDIEFELGNDLPDLKPDVQLVWEPPWSPERLSEKARRLMGW